MLAISEALSAGADATGVDRATQDGDVADVDLETVAEANAHPEVFAEKTVKGIEANEEMCAYWLERSAALATALAPQIGYKRAAELSKQSVKENVLIRDLVRREKVLPESEIDEVLDLRKMTEIGVPGGKHGGVSAG